MEVIKLDLIPSGKMPSLHASQYDDGREHGIDLFENGVAYKLDGTETLTINERKGDDCICSLDIENTFTGSNHIVFASTEQMCAVWGNNICELVIAKGEKTIGTLNFILEIEPSPTENGIESESEIKNLKTQVEAITEEVIGDDYYTAEQTDNAIATAIEGKADTTYVDTELDKKADKTDTYTKSQVDTALNGKADKDTTYTKTQVDSEISRLDGRIDTKANASDVYTKSQTDNLLNDKADVSDLPDMSQYYDKSEVDDLLDDKANSDDVYGKAYIDTALSGKANVGTSYTKSEEDDLLANKADKSDTYTKAQVDDIVYNILPDDTASGSVANFTTSLALPIKSLEVDVNAVQSAGTPTPASPLPISGWSAISLVKCGKNLFTTTAYDSYKNPDGTYTLTGNQSIGIKNSLSKFVGTQITISVDVSTTSINNVRVEASVGGTISNGNNIASNSSGVTKITVTPTTENDYFDITFGSGGNNQFTIRSMQIEIGSSVSSFEPYNSNTEVINLGGTYYGGHFTQDKDGHRQFVATHEYETNMGQYNYAYVSASNCFRTTNFNKAYKRTVYTIIANSLCSHYGGAKLQEVLNQSANDSTYAFGIVGLYNGSVLFRNTNYSDATAFKSSMQGVTMTFELETPIIIDLPDGEPIITLNGTNNIFADTGDCAVEYKCSVAEYVANHSGGGGAKSLGGVFLGGSNSGSEEEQKEEPTEEPKEVTKTLGDEPISKK